MKMITFLKYSSLFLSIFSLTAALPTVLKHRTRNLKVYGGDDAAPGQFPFVVSLKLLRTLHNCGGSIINENWVLTAAYCLAGILPAWYAVVVGTTSLNTGGTVFNVSKIIIHPNYNENTVTDDIGLIKIEGAFTFDDLVQTIAIGRVQAFGPAIVIGWGATEVTIDQSSNELKYANLTVLSDDDCTKMSEGGDYILPRGPGQVCALASKGISPCWGDSGGPLVSNGTLIGVVSYAVSPCAKGFPDVYTRVSYYNDWINDIIENN